MTLTVRDTARVLTAMAGTDPADPATAEADALKTDYVTTLSTTALEGKRIGVMGFADGFGTDAPFEEALSALRREGAILVDIDKFEGRDEMGEAEFTVLLAGFKADLHAYPTHRPPTVETPPPPHP